MLVVLAAPAVNACNGDDRGLLTCIRGLVDDRFDLRLEPDAPAQLEATRPVATDAAPADPPPDMIVAEAPVPKPGVEPSRSLVPPSPEKPIASPAAPPRVAAVPDVVATPEVPAAAPDLEPESEPTVEAQVEEPAEIETPPATPPTIAAVPEEVATAGLPDVAPEIAPATEPAVEAQVEDPADIDTPPAASVLEDAPIDRIITALAVETPVEVDAGPAPVTVVPWFMPPMPAPLPETPPALATTAADTDPASVVEPEPESSLTISSAEAPIEQPEPELQAAPAPLPEVAIEPDTEAAQPGTTESAVAAIDPVPPAEPAPERVGPVLAATIDAVEIDGDGNFIAGNGPAGATMRLYVDGLPVGVSPVEGGRWLIEGTDLLAEGQQVLKVEALDPLTGRLLDEASIVFDGPLGPSAAEEVVAPAPGTELDAVPSAEAVAADQPPVDPPAEDTVTPSPAVDLPPIVPIVPVGETPSVTILGSAADASIETLPADEAAGSVLILGTTLKAPAIVARFALPAEEVAPLAVLRAVPIGDPGAGRFVSGKAIIRRGDTLWDIAHRFYGRGVHYRTIFRANRDLIARPGRIYPGQVFDLPLVYDDE